MEVRMLATALLVAVATGSVPVTAAMAGGDRAMWRHGEAPALAALPRSGEGWLTLAVRLCGDVKAAAALREANARLSHPLKDVRVVVPWSILREDLRVTVVQVLFPADRRVTSGWEHQIRAPWGGDGESWWELAEWFCGEGSLYPRVRDANPGAGMFPVRGTRILIPQDVLLPEFRAVVAQSTSGSVEPWQSVASVSVALTATKPAQAAPASRSATPSPTSAGPTVPAATRTPLPPTTAVEIAPPSAGFDDGRGELTYLGSEAIYRL
ncbi:MAG: hypothetical protein GW878_03850, partial [Acidobacteria bacterium]|nr:hypothetical protein [Acidobacteriota bacterium]